MKRSKRGPYKMPRHEVVQPLDPSYRLIPLTQGQNTIVDAENYEWLNQWNWVAAWNPHTGSFYARRTDRSSGKKRTLAMQREILACKREELGDHKNHDTLDNRKKNLRKCSKSQNASNRIPQKPTQHGFVGVYITTNSGKWAANIGINKKLIHLGCFETREDAAMARDKAALRFHGKFARLNFPERHTCS